MVRLPGGRRVEDKERNDVSIPLEEAEGLDCSKPLLSQRRAKLLLFAALSIAQR